MLVAAVAAVAAAALSGCGASGPDEPAGPLTIGVVSACGSEFGTLYENTVAGATLPLLERGARLVPWPPASPYAGYAVHGRQVRLAYACSDGTPDSAREQARQLVEGAGAEFLLGPARDVEGKAMAVFAQNHPRVTAVDGSAANQASTLAVRSRRFFRFLPDAAQWSGGLGAYAYRELGWRTAVVLGEDTTVGQTEAAGFIAEFCSLGGRVPARLWAPPDTSDFGSYAGRAAQVGADGVFSSLDGPALHAYLAAAPPSLAPLVVSATGLGAGADLRLNGAVGALPPSRSDRRGKAWRRYAAGLRRRFPRAAADRLETLAYYDGMTAILTALERASSSAQADVRQELARLVLETPHGRVRLDRNRNAISANVLVRIDRGRTREIRRVPEVEQTFGGYFTPETRPPSRIEPACLRHEPPVWAR